MRQVNFEYPTHFLGRNGEFKSMAIELSGGDNWKLNLYPVTSKGVQGRCYIEIPESNVVEFVNTIKLMYPGKFQEAALLEKVGYYLYNTEDDDGNKITISQQITLIENCEDTSTLIDDIDGVGVWEPLQYHYTVADFMQEVLN